ncbi:hypothetical protein V8D89_003653 [Ganoderma adspersum]
MHIALHTNGGVDHNLAVPHTMLYTLESLSDDSDHSQHVSRAFRILDTRIVHKDNFAYVASHWDEDYVTKHERALAGWRQVTADPALASAFPITFIPILRLVFDDLNLLCRHAIGLGIVFECPDDTTQIYPEAGEYSRVGRKGWKKISKPDVWEDVLEPMMSQHPSEFLSGLPLELIWALFENW